MSDVSKLKIRVDLHVHTRRYSPCAETLDPEKIDRIMVRRGLHGVVITEHDYLWSCAEITFLNRRLKSGRIYRGIEVTSRNGHFVVIGLNDQDGLIPGMRVHDLIEKAKSKGAAAIWAHPGIGYSNIPEPLNFTDMPAGLDAVEVASGVTLGNNARLASDYARKCGYACVGGSDAHVLDQVGSAYTLFAELPQDEKALATAIRCGCCEAGRDPECSVCEVTHAVTD